MHKVRGEDSKPMDKMPLLRSSSSASLLAEGRNRPGAFLSSGRFFEVRQVCLENDQIVARKFPCRGVGGRRYDLRRRKLANEIMILRHLQSDVAADEAIASSFIVTLLQVNQSQEGDLSIDLELLSGGTLYTVLYHTTCCFYSKSIDQRHLVELCEAVYFLHQHFVVHADIKPLNILFSGPSLGRGRLVLADFDAAVRLTTDHQVASPQLVAGSVHYISPEVAIDFKKNNLCTTQYSGRSDVFSTALVLFEMVYRRRFYDFDGRTVRPKELLDCVQRATVSVTDNPNWKKRKRHRQDHHMLAILQNGLCINPADRCTSRQLLQHIKDEVTLLPPSLAV